MTRRVAWIRVPITSSRATKSQSGTVPFDCPLAPSDEHQRQFHKCQLRPATFKPREQNEF